MRFRVENDCFGNWGPCGSHSRPPHDRQGCFPHEHRPCRHHHRDGPRGYSPLRHGSCGHERFGPFGHGPFGHGPFGRGPFGFGPSEHGSFGHGPFGRRPHHGPNPHGPFGCSFGRPGHDRPGHCGERSERHGPPPCCVMKSCNDSDGDECRRGSGGGRKRHRGPRHQEMNTDAKDNGNDTVLVQRIVVERTPRPQSV